MQGVVGSSPILPTKKEAEIPASFAIWQYICNCCKQHTMTSISISWHHVAKLPLSVISRKFMKKQKTKGELHGFLQIHFNDFVVPP